MCLQTKSSQFIKIAGLVQHFVTHFLYCLNIYICYFNMLVVISSALICSGELCFSSAFLFGI